MNTGRRGTSTGKGRAALGLGAVLLVVALAPVALPAAQPELRRSDTTAFRRCDGDTITAVDIRAFPPASAPAGRALPAEAASRALRLPHTTTRKAVIAAYVRLTAGNVCTELDREESERILRAQPFVASANVRAIPAAPGHVRIQVDVVDELPFIAGARAERGTIASLLLGSLNVGGRGLAAEAEVTRGFEYRPGFAARLAKHGLFGRPAYAVLEARRRPVIGEHIAIEVAEPFVTDFQVRAYHVRALLESGYVGLLGPDGDVLSAFVRRTSYNAGWVARIGRAGGRRPVGLLGAALIGEDVRSSNSLVIVSDTGLIAGPVDPFGARFPDFAITRFAVIGGVRALRFERARGFDALTADQDLGIGVQVDLLVAPVVLAARHSGDVLLASVLYAGAGNAKSFYVARALAEAFGDRGTGRWGGVVAGGRVAWYRKPADNRTRIASLNFSAVHRTVFPMQLTLRDADGGLAGYGDAAVAGGQRVVAGVEERLLLPTLGRRGDLAVGVFGTAGKLWAGDVPFGRTTGVLAAGGVSILAAFPKGGRRTYRLDVAFPFDKVPGRATVEWRFSVGDRTRTVWAEPRDVAAVRTGAVPVSLMKW